MNEVTAMSNGDKPLRYDRKRKGEDDIADLDIPVKDPRPDLKFLDKSTSSKLADDDAKYKLKWFISQNKNGAPLKSSRAPLSSCSGATHSVNLHISATRTNGYVWVPHCRVATIHSRKQYYWQKAKDICQ
ncbi:unnamed protein product [Phytophthora fragariaefolia]|uniref:Unnamed protein product n=1 Tax=Phytophthora fragariaefolia TaxID=1490495 RepID=A0A9W6X009_9STRA|nr:unnamed protein product [Phytophthora fragariaefolia]